MSGDDEYRRQADDALQMADHAKSDQDRSAWLGVAEGWLSLINRLARTAEQKFDDQTRERQTAPSSDQPNWDTSPRSPPTTLRRGHRPAIQTPRSSRIHHAYKPLIM
jgi:hypothetical protein